MGVAVRECRSSAATRCGRSRPANYNSSKPTDLEWQRMEQSVAVQMTYAGAPMVYYGDEVGMWGGTDPDDRQPMIWKDLEPYDDPEVTFNQGLFDNYVRLIAIHRRFARCKPDLLTRILADDARTFWFTAAIWAIARYVLVNRSAEAQSVDFPVGIERGRYDRLARSGRGHC